MNNSLQDLRNKAQAGLNAVDGAVNSVNNVIATSKNIVANGEALVNKGLGTATKLAGVFTDKPTTFAQTTWSTGATDELATADVYDLVPGGNPVTNVKSFFDGIDFGLADLVRGGKFLAKNIPLITGLARGGLAIFDRTSLTSRILGASSLFNSAWREIAARNPDLSDGILKTIKDNGQLFASVNGVITRVATTNFNDISSVGRLINTYTGKNDLFSLEDIDGQVGMIAGIVNEATRYGIPNSFAGLTSQLTNTEIVRRVADRVLPDVVVASDSRSLKSIGLAMGAKGTLALNPNIIGDFAGRYNSPYQATVGQTRDEFRNIVDAYDTLDNTWTAKEREGGPAINLNQILKGSKDFISTISEGAKSVGEGTEKLFALASVVKPVNVEEKLKEQFPATVWRDNAVIVNTVRDPVATAIDPYVYDKDGNKVLPVSYGGWMDKYTALMDTEIK